eukprot:CAMPEP_0179008078 /NCGR_PEP_ID=MMETSP0795-20121207/15510_1 /TAXON_ID=88552 /ORGANISM="Amoebophrya sp., Strain Ameob2" /LENGTH=1151 /DNA_ID=CAMNT_0020703111 /DNA_START=21 /DNA_END=3477 /DNA_ORIENTATION=-
MPDKKTAFERRFAGKMGTFAANGEIKSTSRVEKVDDSQPPASDKVQANRGLLQKMFKEAGLTSSGAAAIAAGGQAPVKSRAESSVRSLMNKPGVHVQPAAAAVRRLSPVPVVGKNANANASQIMSRNKPDQRIEDISFIETMSVAGGGAGGAQWDHSFEFDGAPGAADQESDAAQALSQVHDRLGRLQSSIGVGAPAMASPTIGIGAPLRIVAPPRVVVPSAVGQNADQNAAWHKALAASQQTAVADQLREAEERVAAASSEVQEQAEARSEEAPAVVQIPRMISAAARSVTPRRAAVVGGQQPPRGFAAKITATASGGSTRAISIPSKPPARSELRRVGVDSTGSASSAANPNASVISTPRGSAGGSYAEQWQRRNKATPRQIVAAQQREEGTIPREDLLEDKPAARTSRRGGNVGTTAGAAAPARLEETSAAEADHSDLVDDYEAENQRYNINVGSPSVDGRSSSPPPGKNVFRGENVVSRVNLNSNRGEQAELLDAFNRTVDVEPAQSGYTNRQQQMLIRVAAVGAAAAYVAALKQKLRSEMQAAVPSAAAPVSEDPEKTSKSEDHVSPTKEQLRIELPALRERSHGRRDSQGSQGAASGAYNSMADDSIADSNCGAPASVQGPRGQANRSTAAEPAASSTTSTGSARNRSLTRPGRPPRPPPIRCVKSASLGELQRLESSPAVQPESPMIHSGKNIKGQAVDFNFYPEDSSDSEIEGTLNGVANPDAFPDYRDDYTPMSPTTGGGRGEVDFREDLQGAGAGQHQTARQKNPRDAIASSQHYHQSSASSSTVSTARRRGGGEHSAGDHSTSTSRVHSRKNSARGSRDRPTDRYQEKRPFALDKRSTALNPTSVVDRISQLRDPVEKKPGPKPQIPYVARVGGGAGGPGINLNGLGAGAGAAARARNANPNAAASSSSTASSLPRRGPEAGEREKDKDNSRLVKKTEDLLLFSKKPRPVQYSPRREPLGAVPAELGRLGPDLDNDDLLYKKAVAHRVKDFSDQLRNINRKRTRKRSSSCGACAVGSSQQHGRGGVGTTREQEIQSKRERALAFAKQVPRPKMVAQRQIVAEVDSNGASVSTNGGVGGGDLNHIADNVGGGEYNDIKSKAAEANIDHQLAQNAQDRFLAENVKKFLLEQSSRGGGGGGAR